MHRSLIQDIRSTSTFRLTILFGAVFLVAIAALLALIYVLSARELTSRTDLILRQEAAILQAVPRDRLARRIDAEVAQNAAGLSYIELQTADGSHVAGNLQLPAAPISREPTEIDPGLYGRVPIRLLVIDLSDGDRLIVGRDISPVLDLRQRVLAILVYSGIVASILVLLSGIVLSLGPLRRVRELQRVSRTIAAGAIGVRMPISGRGDELDLFAATVNIMVDELERVIAQVKGVTDAIAHDLRTPLTRVRSQLYRARKSPPDDHIGDMLGAAIDDLDVVLDRFAALLRISQIEAGGQKTGFAVVALADLVANVHELYEPLAAERGIDLIVESGTVGSVWGDEKLLFEAVSNLVDNAIKFSNDGGRVVISVAGSAVQAVVEVRDNGAGLAMAERQAVLRRFHRGTNAANVPGTGLGLSLVAAIVHLHGFRLEFGDTAGGLVVRIVGPRLERADPEQ